MKNVVEDSAKKNRADSKKGIPNGNTFNKLCVVASRVVTHKAVEFSGYIIVVEYSAYDIGLGGPSMVSE
jgi:hypothetical protein